MMTVRAALRDPVEGESSYAQALQVVSQLFHMMFFVENVDVSVARATTRSIEDAGPVRRVRLRGTRSQWRQSEGGDRAREGGQREPGRAKQFLVATRGIPRVCARVAMNGTKTRGRPRESEGEDEAEADVECERDRKESVQRVPDGLAATAPALAPAPAPVSASAPPALPPTVEGRECTEAEMAAKRANGAYYLDDIWRIVREYPTAGVFECPGELETLPRRLDGALDAVGYRVVEASARFEGLVHATQLAQAWWQPAHDARNSETLYPARRTAGNTGPARRSASSTCAASV